MQDAIQIEDNEKAKARGKDEKRRGKENGNIRGKERTSLEKKEKTRKERKGKGLEIIFYICISAARKENNMR